jgi:hypothetical protein
VARAKEWQIGQRSTNGGRGGTSAERNVKRCSGASREGEERQVGRRSENSGEGAASGEMERQVRIRASRGAEERRGRRRSRGAVRRAGNGWGPWEGAGLREGCGGSNGTVSHPQLLAVVEEVQVVPHACAVPPIPPTAVLTLLTCRRAPHPAPASQGKGPHGTLGKERGHMETLGRDGGI